MATKTKKSRRAAAVEQKEAPQDKAELVRVRATKTGYYGDLLRNVGEVFLFDVKYMEPAKPEAEREAIVADLPAEDRLALLRRNEDFDVIDVGGKEYLLPTWVELVEEGEAIPAGAETPKGHPKVATKENVI